MPDRPALEEARRYLYDGSFEGMLCCIFTAFLRRETPAAIDPEGEGMQLSLIAPELIRTEPDKAKRVADALRGKVSPEALRMVKYGYLCDIPEKELCVLAYVRAVFSGGRQALTDFGDNRILQLSKAVRALRHEAHLYTGFVRFSDCGPALVSVIEPKNHVLPLLANHFRERLAGENYLIYDRTHRQALLGSGGHTAIGPMEEFELPKPNAEEDEYRVLWRRFYQSTDIRQRRNMRCQTSHLPKHFRPFMTEFQDAPGRARAGLPPQKSDSAQPIEVPEAEGCAENRCAGNGTEPYVEDGACGRPQAEERLGLAVRRVPPAGASAQENGA